MIIRDETEADSTAITRVNDLAFGSPVEGRLVDLLRAAGRVTLSLVAESEGQIVGHAMFSAVTTDPQEGGPQWVALGPIAVLPERQGKGIGSRLMYEGIARMRQAGYKGIVLLGSPAYYPRFGFLPARDYNLTSDYGDGPEFQALGLRPSAASTTRLRIIYAPEFSSPALDCPRS